MTLLEEVNHPNIAYCLSCSESAAGKMSRIRCAPQGARRAPPGPAIREGKSETMAVSGVLLRGTNALGGIGRFAKCGSSLLRNRHFGGAFVGI
jgi:hypothetical protein